MHPSSFGHELSRIHREELERAAARERCVRILRRRHTRRDTVNRST